MLYDLEYSFKIPKKVQAVIDKYYPAGTLAHKYFFIHSVKVTELALKIAEHNPQLNPDIKFILKGAMLHDIGIIKTNASDIGCNGKYRYIAHTYLGREILEKEGFSEIARVCETHVGVGLSKKDIQKSNFPLPHRDMLPKSVEEKIICYADKFYSKSEKHLLIPKPEDKIRKKVLKYGNSKLKRFEDFVELFGIDYVYVKDTK